MSAAVRVEWLLTDSRDRSILTRPKTRLIFNIVRDLLKKFAVTLHYTAKMESLVSYSRFDVLVRKSNAQNVPSPPGLRIF